MESQFGKKFTVKAKPEPEPTSHQADHYVLMAWEDGADQEDACFDPDKARELGQALIDAADNKKRCRCGRTV